MLKETRVHLSRVRSLEQLRRGDHIEARLSLGPNYDNAVILRGRVQETAPGIGVVWITDHVTGLRKVINSEECSVWRIS